SPDRGALRDGDVVLLADSVGPLLREGNGGGVLRVDGDGAEIVLQRVCIFLLGLINLPEEAEGLAVGAGSGGRGRGFGQSFFRNGGEPFAGFSVVFLRNGDAGEADFALNGATRCAI